MTGARSRLDTAYAEIVLFLNGSKETIPHELPRLTTEQATEITPHRLTSTCAETDTLSVRVGCEIVVPQDDFSLEQEETS